jgi:bifunctional UDP-N-acetylglucosamine pyrophosphorylase/glucosamine-1-phosphate N-acetyltransferase
MTADRVLGIPWAAVIMAAGDGSRMNSRYSKVLHEVAGRPILRRVIDAARGAGIPRIVVVVSPNAGEIRREAGRGVVLAVQQQPQGTADAVLSAQSACGRDRYVLVLNGDLPLIRAETLSAICASHQSSDQSMTILTAFSANPHGYARVKRDRKDRVIGLVEERDATGRDLEIQEVNAGVYAFRADWLWSHLGQVEPSPITGELYLTDLVRMAVRENGYVASALIPPDEACGVNTRADLALAERYARDRVCERAMESGVTIIDPDSTFLDEAVQIGRDTIIHPNTHIFGDTVIGETCQIGPNTIIKSSTLDHGCIVLASVIENSTLESAVHIGPFSHLREGAVIESGAVLGNYAEVKKSRIGAGTQMHHFSYIGDAQVGQRVNIGAGTITCNYDGKEKHETVIGEGAFIGSDTMLVAPVVVGEGARTGAGSVVTRNVAPGTLVLGVPARERVEAREAETGAAEEPGASGDGTNNEPSSKTSIVGRRVCNSC